MPKFAMLASILVAGLVVVAPMHGAGDEQSDSDALRAILEEIRKKHDLPALVAAFLRSQGPIVAAAVGVRRRGFDVPVTLDDQFHLGSDTKSMTAFLIAWLIEHGLLSWDTPLAMIFPELADDMTDDFKKITPAHLLTHRAGLPANFPEGLQDALAQKTTRAQRLGILKELAGSALEHKPGTKYLYSNVGYTLAGAVAEKIADASWEDLMQKHIFGPLKMTTAGYGPMGTLGKLDQPYQHTAKGRAVAPYSFSDNLPAMGPAGRVHCSLPDWAQFVRDHLRGSRGEKALLKPATYRKMDTSPHDDPFYTLGGWGGRPKDDKQKMVLAHDGSNTLNHCTAMIVPEADYAILVATNQGGDAGEKGCHEARTAIRLRFVEGIK